MSVYQKLLAYWAALVALSVGTVTLSASGLWWVILSMAVLKAWLIADGFMELRHGPRMWRLLLLGWPLVLGVLIALTKVQWRGVLL